MTHLCSTNEVIVVGAGSELRAFSIQDGNCLLKYTHDFDKDAKDGNNQAVNERIEDLIASKNTKYVCALFSDKKIIVWDTEQGWKCLGQIRTKRRSTALSFNQQAECLFAADKSGDLYKYAIIDIDAVNSEDQQEDEDSWPEPILGHVSMLLDVDITYGGKYILTADRDEKIRVSSAQNPFVVESFCLGHTDFVCSVLSIRSEDASKSHFISASGDGTVRQWNAASGKELSCHSFAAGAENLPSADGSWSGSKVTAGFIPSLLATHDPDGLLATASQQEKQTNVHIFKVDGATSLIAYDCKFTVNCHRLGGIAFGQSLPVICALGITAEGKLNLTAYEYCNGRCCVFDSETVKLINDQLQDIPVEDLDVHKGLFKATSFDNASENKRKRPLHKPDPANAERAARKAKRAKWVRKGTLAS